MGKKIGITILILAALGAVYYFFFAKRKKVLLTHGNNNGKTIYQKGNKYYLISGTTEIEIPQSEYDYLLKSESGDCIAPPKVITTNSNTQQNLISNTLNPNGNNNIVSESCFYYGYEGYINACGGCSLKEPATPAKG